MQIADILRKAADVIDQAADEAGIQQEPAQDGQEIVPTFPGQASALELTNVDNDDETCGETMVSPLQQQHELLKKSQGVDNNVSEFAGDDDCDQIVAGEVDADGFDDESDEEKEVEEATDDLAIMKKMAGIGEPDTGAPINHAVDCQPATLNPRANAALEANNKPHLKHTQRRPR
jgi:hypothetical protein